MTKFETSKSGARFRQTEIKFGQNTSNTNAAKAQTITINRNKSYQKVLGFGCAFTAASGKNIATLPPSMQTRLLGDYFGRDGIEYSMGRIEISSADNGADAYSYDDYPNDFNLTHFSLNIVDYIYKVRPTLIIAKLYLDLFVKSNLFCRTFTDSVY